jgi:tetratricopeptide (TPR) repeat protein
MSHGVNINTNYDAAEQRRGREAIRRAQTLARGASPAEGALIGAAAQRFAYTGSGDEDRSARAFRDAMNAAATQFPLDDDIAALAAEAEFDVHPWSFFARDGTPVDGTLGAIARLDTVLARDPQHIQANHLLVHAWEESSHPENALPAARRLAAMNFEPGAEHLAHMPAHTFMRVGDYHAAGEANARALALYTDYLTNDPAGDATYFDHDCAFGVDAFMMAGEFARAQRIAATCAARGYDLTSHVDLRFRRWDALAATDDEDDFVAGMLAAHASHALEAAKHLRELQKLSGDVPAIETSLLEARLQTAKGDAGAEIAALRDAVRKQDDSGYAEPPAFFYPVRETLGGAYFRSQRYGDAERTFRDELTHDVDNPRALYGLAETLDREGRPSEASTARVRFTQAWAHADASLDLRDY